VNKKEKNADVELGYQKIQTQSYFNVLPRIINSYALYWIIDNFCSLFQDEHKIGEIWSDNFGLNEKPQCYLSLSYNEEVVGLHLQLISDYRSPLNVQCNLSILDEENRKRNIKCKSLTSLKRVYAFVRTSLRFGVINKYVRVRDFEQWKEGAPDEGWVEVRSLGSPFTSSFSHSAFTSPLILIFGIHSPLSVGTLLVKSYFRYKLEKGQK